MVRPASRAPRPVRAGGPVRSRRSSSHRWPVCCRPAPPGRPRRRAAGCRRPLPRRSPATLGAPGRHGAVGHPEAGAVVRVPAPPSLLHRRHDALLRTRTDAQPRRAPARPCCAERARGRRSAGGRFRRRGLDRLPDHLHVELTEHRMRGGARADRACGRAASARRVLEPLPQQAQRPLRAGVEEQADGQCHHLTMADQHTARSGRACLKKAL